jgi:hypothetical protein
MQFVLIGLNNRGISDYRAMIRQPNVDSLKRPAAICDKASDWPVIG